MVTAPADADAAADSDAAADAGADAGALEAGAALGAVEGAVLAPPELHAATKIPAAMTVVRRRARLG
jgi:hypothetical protein